MNKKYGMKQSLNKSIKNERIIRETNYEIDEKFDEWIIWWLKNSMHDSLEEWNTRRHYSMNGYLGGCFN